MKTFHCPLYKPKLDSAEIPMYNSYIMKFPCVLPFREIALLPSPLSLESCKHYINSASTHYTLSSKEGRYSLHQTFCPIIYNGVLAGAEMLKTPL